MDSTKLCECGCGRFTAICTHTDHRAGVVKGGGMRFLPGHRSRVLGMRPPRQPLQGVAPHERFWAKVAKSEDCWLWEGVRKDNGSGMRYGIFHTYSGPKDKNGKQHYAHRYSWELHFGPIPEGLVVCHRCDNPPCVRPDHLFLGTARDNNRDMVEKGRHNTGRGVSRNRGDKNANAKLNEDLVRAMRSMYASGRYSHVGLAESFGVTAGCVQSVLENRTWAWVEDYAGSR